MLVRPTHLRRILQFIAISLLSGCTAISDARATLEQIFALQKQLQAAFPGETIRVSESTSGQLSVDLVNSRLASLPADERAARTLHIATFVRNHYGRAGAIQTISIVFKSETGAAGFKVSTSQATDYVIEDLAVATPPSITSNARAGDTAVTGLPSAPTDTTGRGTAASGIKSVSRWNSF